MEQFLYYLLRASIVMALFYGFYKLFFGKNTFHNFNRFSLITIVMLVGVLPFFRFNLLPEKKTEPVTIENLPIDYSTITVTEITEMPAPTLQIPWMELLTAVLVIGFLFALTRYLVGLFQLAAIISKSEKQTLADETVLCGTDKNISPFSWLKYIVMSQKDVTADNRAIINHERAHIRLKHSMDMVFFDLFTCVFWFNPFSWLLRREIQSVHEYQADEQVLNNGIDAKQYQLLLIRKSVGEHKFALANNFRQRDLHKRITMMMKNKTNKRMKWNYTAALPVLFLAMVALSVPKLNAKVMEKEAEETIETVAEKITVAGQVLDEAGQVIPMVAVINKEDNSRTVTDSNGNFVFNVEKGATVSFVMVGYKEQKVIFNKPETNFKVSLEKGEGENTELITVRIKGLDDVGEAIDDQTKLTVSGLVVSKGEFIPGVVVVIKDSTVGTATDTKGAFVIKADKGDVLNFVMVGYKPSEYKVEKAEKNLVIVLQPDDVVAVGGGKMSDLQGKVKSIAILEGKITDVETKDGKTPLYVKDGIAISKEELEKIQPNEIESISVLKNASATAVYGDKGKDGVIIVTTKKAKHISLNGLQGKVSGINDDNKESTLLLRGVSEDKKPLIIIDGKKLPNDFNLNSISPDDIESITVLKDRAAAAIYANEGENGVILIMTKQNLKSKVSVDTNNGEQIGIHTYKSGEVKTFGDFKNTEIYINGKKSTIEQVKKLREKDIKQMSAAPADLDLETDLHKKYNVPRNKSVFEIK